MVLFALIGMGIRTLIYYYFSKWNITSDYTAVFADLPCNFFGCFIMGIYVPSKNIWNTISPALSLGIGTGMCGCITTWSAWNLSITKLFMMKNYN
jgi:fluoride ion exporter CrcB/FEX